MGSDRRVYLIGVPQRTEGRVGDLEHVFNVYSFSAMMAIAKRCLTGDEIKGEHPFHYLDPDKDMFTIVGSRRWWNIAARANRKGDMIRLRLDFTDSTVDKLELVKSRDLLTEASENERFIFRSMLEIMNDWTARMAAVMAIARTMQQIKPTRKPNKKAKEQPERVYNKPKAPKKKRKSRRLREMEEEIYGDM